MKILDKILKILTKSVKMFEKPFDFLSRNIQIILETFGSYIISLKILVSIFIQISQ